MKLGETKTPPSKKKPVAGRKHYGGGLYLQTGESGSASWLLRYQRGLKTNAKGEIKPAEHWMGLGPKSVFSAKQARARARAAQQQIYDDIDPLEARRKQRTQQALEAARSITFADATQQYYDSHEGKWSSAKHRQTFLNTLKQYAFPVIGKLPVADVDTAAVLHIVEPIWITKNQTSIRIRGRIEAILDWCTVRGYRHGDNPARWAGHLSEALPTGGKIGKVIHHAALPYADIPSFVAQLSQRQGIGPKALEFMILTASRTGEALGVRWNEIDLDAKVWTVPPERMKGRKEHRVPLTDRTIKLLKSLPREAGNNGLLFIGTKVNAPLGKMVLPDLVDAMGHDVTIHGFRASFRTWAAESTGFPREVIEAALAHKTGTAVELAYQRSDVLEKRRQLMEAWSAFVATPVRKGGNVTPIRKGGV
jgi:integrase